MTRPGILVIGVGNEFRRDDAVGLLVVRALRHGPLCLRTDVELEEHRGEGATLIDLWAGRQRVIVVDAAMQPDASPGTILQMTEGESSLAAGVEVRTSGHAFSVMDAVLLGREMNRLPDWLRIYCVLGADFGRGTTPSPAVRAAIPLVASRIVATVGG